MDTCGNKTVGFLSAPPPRHISTVGKIVYLAEIYSRSKARRMQGD